MHPEITFSCSLNPLPSYTKPLQLCILYSLDTIVNEWSCGRRLYRSLTCCVKVCCCLVCVHRTTMLIVYIYTHKCIPSTYMGILWKLRCSLKRVNPHQGHSFSHLQLHISSIFITNNHHMLNPPLFISLFSPLVSYYHSVKGKKTFPTLSTFKKTLGTPPP